MNGLIINLTKLTLHCRLCQYVRLPQQHSDSNYLVSGLSGSFECSWESEGDSVFQTVGCRVSDRRLCLLGTDSGQHHLPKWRQIHWLNCGLPAQRLRRISGTQLLLHWNIPPRQKARLWTINWVKRLLLCQVRQWPVNKHHCWVGGQYPLPEGKAERSGQNHLKCRFQHINQHSIL